MRMPLRERIPVAEARSQKPAAIFKRIPDTFYARVQLIK